MAGPTIFTDLDNTQWGTGTTVAVTLTTGTRAFVFFGARSVLMNTAGGFLEMSYRVSGATTTAAAISRATRNESAITNHEMAVGRVHFATVTAGSNTFTLQALVGDAGQTGTMRYPYITVVAL